MGNASAMPAVGKKQGPGLSAEESPQPQSAGKATEHRDGCCLVLTLGDGDHTSAEP